MPLVQVDHLVKYYPIVGGFLRRHIGDVKAVDDVSFEVRRGEVFGLVGESGCGKSTLGRTLVQLQPPTGGSASLDGETIFDKKGSDLRKLRRRMQIIFQDPVGSLNPRMPISDIIGEGLLAQADDENHWGDRKVRDKRVEDYLEAVGLRRDYTRRYPHEFSGGQRQRIGIARALALDPDFVVCDEPVSALDVSIQSQILNLLLDLRREFDLTYLFIAHNLSVVQYISDRVGVMYLGKLVEMGDVEDVYSTPRHPYTVALLSAVPDADPRIRKKRLVLTGDVPSPAAPPSGCRFHTRCWLREQLGNPEECTTLDPDFRDIGERPSGRLPLRREGAGGGRGQCGPGRAGHGRRSAARRPGRGQRGDAGRRRAECRLTERGRSAGGGFAGSRRLSIMPGSMRRDGQPGRPTWRQHRRAPVEETEPDDTDQNRSSGRRRGDPVRGLQRDIELIGSRQPGARQRSPVERRLGGSERERRRGHPQGRRQPRGRHAGRHLVDRHGVHPGQQLVVRLATRSSRASSGPSRAPPARSSRSWPSRGRSAPTA